MTPTSTSGAPSGQPYVVCLDCGGQFAYDWKEMRMGKRIDSTATAQATDRRNWVEGRPRRSEQAAGPERKS